MRQTVKPSRKYDFSPGGLILLLKGWNTISHARGQIRMDQEMEGVYHYKSGSDHVGVLLEGSASDFSLVQLKEHVHLFKDLDL